MHSSNRRGTAQPCRHVAGAATLGGFPTGLPAALPAGRLVRQLRVRLSKARIQKQELTAVADMKSNDRRSQSCPVPSIRYQRGFPCGRKRGAVRVRH